MKASRVLPPVSAVVAALLLVGGISGTATAEEAADPVTVAVSGTIVVLSDEGLDIVADPDDVGATPEHEASRALVTEQGDIIALDGVAVDAAATGDAFDGTLVVPEPVAQQLEVEPGTEVPAESQLGEEIIAQADEANLEFAVGSGEVVAIPTDEAHTPAAHFFDVALPAAGSPAVSDSTVSSIIGEVGAYWANETDGGISSFTQNLASQRYSSAFACTSGNQSNFWNEAAARFGRSLNDYLNGTTKRHLVVVLPASCGIGPGIGSIGSIHSGGVVAIRDQAGLQSQLLAHEIGHNLGLGHANLSYCGTPSYSEGAGCTSYEYEDIYSVMGFAVEGHSTLTALTAPQRDFIQGYAAGELAVQGVAPKPADAVSYDLKTATAASGLRGVRVTDPLTGEVYYIEYRSGAGEAGAAYLGGYATCLDANCVGGWSYGPGVRIMRLDASLAASKGVMTTALTVVTDGGDPRWAYPALYAGERFVSRSGGLTVAVLNNNDDRSQIRVTTGGWTGSNPAPTVERITGANRIDVGVAISQKAFPSPASVPVVYVTTGYNYPDALSAAPAASKQGGPLLLTEPGGLPTAVRDEIVRLHAARIIVVGGPNSVSPAVFDALQAIAPTTRLGGTDRYAASRNIVRYAWLDAPGASGATTAYIATGANFPDALSASGAGGSFDMPVILVPGTATTLDQPTRQLLLDLGVTSIKVAGGPASVSPALLSQLNAVAPTVRLSGADRFEASKNVARDAFDAADPSQVFIATGYNFPDALAGAALAGMRGAPLIVVPTTCVPRSVLDAIDGWQADKVTLLGGPNSLTARVEYLMPC